MTPWQALILGVLQGITEFLPISSSGHLVIVPYLLGWPEPGLSVDAMLHLGTLVAIVIFFWTDLWRLAGAALRSLRNRSLADPEARIAWAMVLGTIPGALIGFFFEQTFSRWFGLPRTAAAFLLGTAAILFIAEFAGRRMRPLTTISWGDAFAIGLGQAMAIAPGLSRSGTTIAAGLLVGFRREDAARFSFLLGVPIMVGAGLYQVYKLVTAGGLDASVGTIAIGLIGAVVAGYLAIAGLMALVRRHSLIGFGVYCAAFGLLVLVGVLH